VKQILSLLAVVLCVGSVAAQTEEKWDDFKQKVNRYSYSLENDTEVQNFSCLFTTSTYVDFIKENKYDSTFVYPLKLIWTRPGKVYYILLPYPEMSDEKSHPKVLSSIQAVKGQFKGFLSDWLGFLVYSPVSDIPEDALVTFAPDTIQVQYTSGEGALQAKVMKLFLPSGKLIKVSVMSRQNKVVNFPLFTENEGKWICTGWDSQIYQGGKISSGIASRLELQKVQGYWVPSRVDMLVQSTAKPEEKFLSTIFLKNYIFDLELQELQEPESK
jgi:hypothetical protein